MATAAKHDVPLTLTVETVGLESIKQLKTDVAALGKQGADAVPEFAKLGAEIDRLADQAALVSAFGRLADEVDQLSAAQSTASTRSKELTDKLLEQSAATDKLRATEIEAKKTLELAQQALFEKKQALAALKNGTVIDHIPSEKLFTVVSLLGLEHMTTNITIGFNLDSKKLGKKGDIMEVAEGYARNFLLPQKLVAAATADTLNQIRWKY